MGNYERSPLLISKLLSSRTLIWHGVGLPDPTALAFYSDRPLLGLAPLQNAEALLGSPTSRCIPRGAIAEFDPFQNGLARGE
ncbi:MAG: hypothetical protein EA367_01975 [Leptolyngbya sp. DLM2.Bin15]|nr:MAG: hypothetical protein EA367_01975 [Leptolyngbya sp. DLM2.Bin15]